MKKIFSFALVVLVFLTFFLWPRPALAIDEVCCRSGYAYFTSCGEPITPGCYPQNDCTGLSGGIESVSCSNIEMCDGNTQKCVPKTKPPTCGPEPKAVEFRSRVDVSIPGLPYCIFTDEQLKKKLENKCCKGIQVFTLGFSSNDYFCENKNQKGNAIDHCDEIPDNATFVDKNYCGDDPTWKYDEKTGKCVQFAESKWALNFSPCTGGEGISTAVGCIPTNGPDGLKGFLEFVLKWAFFASGGIIVLMVIATGYTLLTSQGNPEKLQAAKENLVALFSGLILIAFSLVLLQTIGADVLKLPTF
ncbi:hypothetical protein HY085_02695 [Candidatus Gottesmanbacteria bacterium]|nr:hypothetical protein [Candidatus Gottesmanbacteria bacterium]